jgi:hypothetical protein
VLGPTSAAVFLLLHSVAAGGGRWLEVDGGAAGGC